MFHLIVMTIVFIVIVTRHYNQRVRKCLNVVLNKNRLKLFKSDLNLKKLDFSNYKRT